MSKLLKLFLLLLCFPLTLGSSMKILPLSKDMPAILWFAMHPNGKLVLTGLENQTAVIWNTENNRYKVFSKNSAAINTVAMSKDGKYFAIQSEEGLIKVFSIDGIFLFELKGHKENIRTVNFSPKGNYLITGSEDNLIKIWDATNGRNIRTIKSHIDPVTYVVYSPDQSSFLSSSEDGSLKIWSQDGNLLREFKDHSGPVMNANFSRDGKKIVTAGDDGKIIIYNLEKNSKKTIEAHSNSVRSVEFSESGNEVLSASEDRSSKLWRVDGTLMQTFLGHEGNVNLARFFQSGKFILTGSDDGTSKVFSLNGKEIATIVITEHGKILYSPSGKFDYDSERLEELLFFHPDDTEFDVDTKMFFQVYYTPGYLSMALSGKEKSIDSLQKLYRDSPPPEVSIKLEKKENNLSEIKVIACDTGGGVSELYLYQNKVLVNWENSRAVRLISNQKCIQRNYQVQLLNGNNSLQAAASSNKGLIGFSKLENLFHEKDNSGKGKLHLFVIGIDQFTDKSLNLDFASKDAMAIKAKFLQKSKNHFDEIKTYELYNKEATKKNILALFKDNSNKISPNDVAIIFFSGHGISKDRNYYFLSTEFSGKKEDFKNSSLSQEELTTAITEIDALKKLILLDTCESGGEWISENSFLSQEFSLGLISKLTGVTVIASSMEKEFAYESSKIGHGFLTKAILESLDLKGEITTSSLIPYVNKRVPELANLLLKKEQFPFISFRGRDFILTEN